LLRDGGRRAKREDQGQADGRTAPKHGKKPRCSLDWINTGIIGARVLDPGQRQTGPPCANCCGKRIAIDGAGRTVIDRPFAEARALVAGFSIWQIKDMDEAVARAKRCPNPMPGPSEIEIRPFYEAADLAEFLTPVELSTPRDGERGKLGVA
jgi:hypothetical protein